MKEIIRQPRRALSQLNNRILCPLNHCDYQPSPITLSINKVFNHCVSFKNINFLKTFWLLGRFHGVIIVHRLRLILLISEPNLVQKWISYPRESFWKIHLIKFVLLVSLSYSLTAEWSTYSHSYRPNLPNLAWGLTEEIFSSNQDAALLQSYLLLWITTKRSIKCPSPLLRYIKRSSKVGRWSMTEKIVHLKTCL